MACCTHALSEWERGCASSPRVPEEPEPLGARGEPVSQPESPVRLVGFERSKGLLLTVLLSCPKQLCQQLA